MECDCEPPLLPRPGLRAQDDRPYAPSRPNCLVTRLTFVCACRMAAGVLCGGRFCAEEPVEGTAAASQRAVRAGGRRGDPAGRSRLGAPTPLRFEPCSRLNGWSMAVQSAAKAARGTSPTRGVADHDSNPTARRMAAAQKEFVAMAASQGRAELNQTSSIGMWETATLGDGLGGGMVAGPMPTSPTRDFAPETAEVQG